MDSTNAVKKRKRQVSNAEKESEINREIIPCNDQVGAGLSMNKNSESQDTVLTRAACTSDL